MKVIYRRCAGLDVHEKTVSAYARILRGKELEIIEATFSTFTEDLENRGDWLRRNRIPRVAMESTGVYWRSVWNILEQSGKLDLLLLNPSMSKRCRATRPTAWMRRALQSWRNTIWREPASFLHQRSGNYAIWCAGGFICSRTVTGLPTASIACWSCRTSNGRACWAR